MSEKSLVKNILPKFVVYIIGAVIVSIVVSKTGFPILFVKLFNVFVFLCFLMYVILDLPPMKTLTPGRAARNLLLTFILMTVIYVGVGNFLPQFNVQFEIETINKPPMKRIEAGPELIAAGKDVFGSNKCWNCHKAAEEGTSMRGPSFDLWQIGLNTREYLIENITDPRKEQAFGFEDKKSKKAMPTYFGEEISDVEMDALLAFLGTLRNEEHMPVRGKEDVDSIVRWDEDPEMIALGKKVFEGELYPPLNCSVCHGKDGIPLLQGARDLRNPNSINKNKMAAEGLDENDDKVLLKNWTDADWYKSVSGGVVATPMAPWGLMFPPKAIWLAIVYAKQFSKPYISGEKQYP